MITAEQFEEATGRKPVDDDLDRCNCDMVGCVGHRQCGWCDQCNLPRFMCGHLMKERPSD